MISAKFTYEARHFFIGTFPSDGNSLHSTCPEGEGGESGESGANSTGGGAGTGCIPGCPALASSGALIE
jgi:hypothetical protein